MRLSGTRDELWRQLTTPDIVADLALTEQVYGQMFLYQYAALYTLARRYDGGHILEIGGFKGRATLVLSLAAPKASIVTLEPYFSEETKKAAGGCKNVEILKTYSFRYLKKSRIAWDMVLVDGNHTRVEQDLPWFNRLKAGGLILFHDYTPEDAARSRCPHVYAVVNDVAKRLGRIPDVLIVDDEKVGMAGFFRRKGEILRGEKHMDILNLGAGNAPIEGAINHDLHLDPKRPWVTVAHDLNELPWPWQNNSFDLVVAKAVFEHLRMDLFRSADECWRLLRPEGKLYLKIPYWRHDNSFADPTHHWQFSLETLHFFDPETVIGRAYSFYPHHKWKIIKGPRLNDVKSSIHCTLQKRSE